MGLDLSTLEPIQVGFTNCYAIDTGDGIALIDTGTNTTEHWNLLTTGLAQRGYGIKDVRWLVLTHAHLDHSGLANRVKEASHAEILIHEDEAFFLREGGTQWHNNEENFNRLFLAHGLSRELIDWYDRQGRRSGWGRNWKNQPELFERNPERSVRWDLIRASDDALAVRVGLVETHHHAPLHRRGDDDENAWRPTRIEPDRTFTDGEILELGKLHLRAIHTPGHTPGHACFYHEESRILFTGDHILKRITPHPGIYFLQNQYEKRTKSLPMYIRSLLRVRDLPCNRVLAAHEGEMNNIEFAVDRIVSHHERRARTAMRAVRLGRQTTFEVLPLLFPHLRAFALTPAMGETVGHLDLLEEQGQVECRFEGELFKYRPVGD